MPITIPTLSYELNTTVRMHREAEGYTQEEFAFLIGKDLKEVQANEDLTTDAAYDINHTNFYVRVLGKVPKDMFFKDSFEEATIKIYATKTEIENKKTGKKTIKFKGTGSFNKKSTVIESYSIPVDPDYDVSAEDQDLVLSILEDWLRNDYFKEGITGYKLYQDLLAKAQSAEIQLPESFRPILVSRAITTLTNKRKKPKLLPYRKLPKTAEKWLLYKEDI
ncbi:MULTISPECIES: hypothetical protein [Sphingobacterium]|uniref:hypothetical protein n=1 Tax=Sphingobacterium TaxID=28453 RepID=UPI0008A553FB|nr:MULTISPECIES: hypothetical protein [Sphingobacterium]OFV12643.1 hypothetical protein HMPREF3127_15925 [Sphingobacterium sp. HMSC13C05]HAK28109.1 hypothetical protein [Sphingobacterium sp.]